MVAQCFGQQCRPFSSARAILEYRKHCLFIHNTCIVNSFMRWSNIALVLKRYQAQDMRVDRGLQVAQAGFIGCQPSGPFLKRTKSSGS